jgi:hypothetical protein
MKSSQGNWKFKIMAIGAALGALTGLGAAYIIVQRAEQQENRPKLTAGEGVKLGLGVLGLLRLISDFDSKPGK